MKATNEGFTLIELLLVITIVGIIAAIGIPQFTQHRMRAYNTSALTDIQTVRIAEHAMFADTQQYASTAGTGCAGDPICTGSVNFGVGGNVDIVLRPGGALEARGTIASYTAATKNVRGDRAYCVDSDTSFIRFSNDAVNVALGVNSSAPAPVPNQDDCAANFPDIQ